jgi:hypothetical protein
VIQLGQVAPAFEVEAAQGGIRRHEWFGESWGVP